MARTGRPPVPVERKRALGNPGKRPLPAAQSVVYLPNASEKPVSLRPLGQAGSELWDRIWTTGQGWISPASDIELVQLVCEQLDERVALRMRVLRDGDRDDRKALRDLDKQFQGLLSLLGLTPTDRTRLGVAEVKTRSKLEEMRDRQARKQEMAAKVANRPDRSGDR